MIKFALDQNNNIVHIDDALPKKDYICSDCNSRLRVKDGKIKSKHFYHVNSEDCGGSGESLVHRLFKDKVASFKTIKIPVYYLSKNNDLKVKELKMFKVVNSWKEVRLLDGKLIADVVLELDNGFKVAVEICYKNPKTEDHINLYRQINLPVLELKVDEDLNLVKSNLLYSKLLDNLKEQQKINTLPTTVRILLENYNNSPLSFALNLNIGFDKFEKVKTYRPYGIRYITEIVGKTLYHNGYTHEFIDDRIICSNRIDKITFNSVSEWIGYFNVNVERISLNNI